MQGMALEASWIPRDLNAESDSLSNLNSSGFDPAKRISVEPDDLAWHLLPDALLWGERFWTLLGSSRGASPLELVGGQLWQHSHRVWQRPVKGLRPVGLTGARMWGTRRAWPAPAPG